MTTRNEVRADGGCAYCDADQGEICRPDCTKPALSPTPDNARLVEALRSAIELIDEAMGRGLSEWDREAAERLPELRAAAVPDIASPAGEDEKVPLPEGYWGSTEPGSYTAKPSPSPAPGEADIIAQLLMRKAERSYSPDTTGCAFEDMLEVKAAALITSLSQEIERMREGLRDLTGSVDAYNWADDDHTVYMSVGRLRRARELAGKEG